MKYNSDTTRSNDLEKTIDSLLASVGESFMLDQSIGTRSLRDHLE